MANDNYSIAISTGVYARLTLERALCGIHKAGFEKIELTSVPGHMEHIIPEKLEEADYIRLERLLKEFDVSVQCISGHVDLIGKKSTIPGVTRVLGPDKALELWKRRINLAERLGAKVVNTSMGEPETTKDYDTFYKYIRRVEDYCSKKGIKVALETHGSIRGKELRPIMEKLNSKWIGVNYDTANVRYYRNTQAENDIENIVDWIFSLHLKDHIGGKGDFNFPALGDGEVHFHEIFRILSKHNWKGPMSVEIEHEGLDAPKKHPKMIDKDVRRSYDFITRLIEKY